MFNMIKSDLYRVAKSKGIYIIVLIIMAIAVYSCINMESSDLGMYADTNPVYKNNPQYVEEISKEKKVGLEKRRQILRKYEAYKVDKQIIGGNSNFYYIFIALTAILLTREFSDSTIKNSLSSFVSRKKYFYSKLITIFGVATFLIVFNNYFIYGINILVNGNEYSSSIIEITKTTIYQLPIFYGMLGLLICFTHLLRKTATFNAVAIPFMFLFQITTSMLSNSVSIISDWIKNYEFQRMLINLAGNPSTDYVLKCGLLGISYMVLFSVIGYYVFKKVEIK